MKLPREFYLRDGLTVARELIGKKLVTNLAAGLTSGIIIETEAYMGTLDAAAHTYRGKTERTKIFYGAGGFVYVYLIYGMHLCTNVVANAENIPEAVLIRALKPVDGVELMKIRRGKKNLRELCSGPGKLSQALGITKNFYGADLCGEEIFIEAGENLRVEATKRINIDYAGEAANYPWRFVVADYKTFI
ncbi:MAG: DNA-3-methyladenine glycosylase [Selenomonadaceae bacterium]|nr:DNA-3-methyladenine glycosylase [Selenomonadaceae bacterium]MBQ6131467.1 DNA-3-methyladenine glycosylase [Selenomonadaceae bacterium]